MQNIHLERTGFSLDLSDMGGGGFVDKCRGTKCNGGTHKGRHRHYGGGPNFDRLCHKLKVLLLLLLLLLCY